MSFHEEQRFSGKAVKLLTLGLLLPIPLVAAVLFLVVPGPRDDPWPLALVFAAVFLLEFGLWLALVRVWFVVEVAEDRVAIRWRPFVRQTIPVGRIRDVEAVSAGLFRRYGAGMGKRWGDKRIRYTVGNDAGVVLTLTDGWRVVLGSRRPEELAEAIRAAMPRSGWE